MDVNEENGVVESLFKIYLDYNVIIFLELFVLIVIYDVLWDVWGNFSSFYVVGKKVGYVIKEVWFLVVNMIGVLEGDIIFILGGIEVNNMVIYLVLEYFYEFYRERENYIFDMKFYVIILNFEYDSI